MLLMAVIHVDGGGLKAHWWRNWISFAVEVVWYALWVAWEAKAEGGVVEMG